MIRMPPRSVELPNCPSLLPIEVGMATSEKVCTIYFDGSCPLCRREISFYQRENGGEVICFVDVSQPDAQLGPGLGRAQSFARFHARDASGRLVSGAEAFVVLWRALPRFEGLAHLARAPGALALLEVAYRGFLVVRPLFQRLMGGRSGVSIALATVEQRVARETAQLKDLP